MTRWTSYTILSTLTATGAPIREHLSPCSPCHCHLISDSTLEMSSCRWHVAVIRSVLEIHEMKGCVQKLQDTADEQRCPSWGLKPLDWPHSLLLSPSSSLLAPRSSLLTPRSSLFAPCSLLLALCSLLATCTLCTDSSDVRDPPISVFEKYNPILRAATAAFFKSVLVTLGCVSNRYEATLHVLSAAITKLGKLTRVTSVYRAPGRALPPSFWQHAREGLAGIIETGCLSTSSDKEVALQYARRSKAKLLFEIRLGFVARGADIGRFGLSQ